VLEDNIRTFATNWTGTGTIFADGGGDAEYVEMDAGEYMESEMVDTGAVDVIILQHEYGAGDNITIKYRHGATPNACSAAAWVAYGGQFTSLGYLEVRVESTL
jgi:hypothetical protein